MKTEETNLEVQQEQLDIPVVITSTDNKRILKIEMPKVIWDADLSIFNRRPIARAWMESVEYVFNETLKLK
jgi:hypothetical protein